MIDRPKQSISRKVSIAPMMDWTDRHCRYYLRGFSPHALLYTEMITAAAILRGDRARLLAFDPEEHPVALQLGGSSPRALAAATRATRRCAPPPRGARRRRCPVRRDGLRGAARVRAEQTGRGMRGCDRARA